MRIVSPETGIDTYLGKIFDVDGVEFSGGNWQKIAIKQAYFKKSSLMVFDEPDAALDPDAERRLFEKMANLSQNGVMYVTHRLSSATTAGQIIVINNGVCSRKEHIQSSWSKKACTTICSVSKRSITENHFRVFLKRGVDLCLILQYIRVLSQNDGIVKYCSVTDKFEFGVRSLFCPAFWLARSKANGRQRIGKHLSYVGFMDESL